MRLGLDRAVIIAFGFIVVLLLAGSFYSPNVLSVAFILQQIQLASFLGIAATGLMLVILIGHIDLSIPWVMTAGAMMSTAAAGWWGPALAIPFGMLTGIAFGLFSGVAVAYLRIPSMIFTLGVNFAAQGLMILYTGGFAPQDKATDLMHFLAVQRTLGGIPNAAFVWAAVGLVVLFILKRTPMGRYIFAIGNSEGATYLSGVNTRGVIIFCFAFSGMASALAGVIVAGRATRAYQAMGDVFLLPAIAAVVLGGADILGGRGSYWGTVAGVILITVLQSILSVLQMPEGIKQIIYGVVIVTMLLFYGRSQRVQG